jgi:hypothetical protein
MDLAAVIFVSPRRVHRPVDTHFAPMSGAKVCPEFPQAERLDRAAALSEPSPVTNAVTSSAIGAVPECKG